MAQRDRVTRLLGTWHAPPPSRPYGPLSGAAKYPAGSRPSKCYYYYGRVRRGVKNTVCSLSCRDTRGSREVSHPSVARPSKCILIVVENTAAGDYSPNSPSSVINVEQIFKVHCEKLNALINLYCCLEESNVCSFSCIDFFRFGDCLDCCSQQTKRPI
jgi:hypothetical protein